MAYWWVSQSKTWAHEVGAGIMWSPFTNQDGKRNPSYDLMPNLRPGDIVFSSARGILKAIGVVRTQASSSPKPKNFGKSGESWADVGWKLDVDYQVLDNQLRLKEVSEIFAPLLPEKYSPMRSDGSVNQAYLFPVPEALANAVLQTLGEPEISQDVATLEELAFVEEEQVLIQDATLEARTKATLIQARRGQGQYRLRVMAFEKRCRVTEVNAKSLLIASHIKPWAVSDNEEKVNGNNGLFLSPHVDKLFNDGHITFSDKGAIEVASYFDLSILDRWGIDPRKNVGKFNEEQRYFLKHHHELEFEKKKAG